MAYVGGSEKPNDSDLQAPGSRTIPGVSQEEKEPRASGQSAGYMELDGAQKDADCEIVEVEGGVSSDLGCCNLYKDPGGSDKFSCGTCEYVTDQGEQQEPSEE